MFKIEIRPAIGADLADIQHCARSAYSKYLKRMSREPAPMHSDFASQIANGCVDVAIGEAGFMGYAVFFYGDDHALLENIAVLPEFSGCEVGRRLIEHVEHRASEGGYQAVELYTNEAMAENLVMYPRLGYVEISRRCEDGYNRVYFRKEIQNQEGTNNPELPYDI